MLSSTAKMSQLLTVYRRIITQCIVCIMWNRKQAERRSVTRGITAVYVYNYNYLQNRSDKITFTPANIILCHTILNKGNIASEHIMRLLLLRLKNMIPLQIRIITSASNVFKYILPNFEWLPTDPVKHVKYLLTSYINKPVWRVCVIYYHIPYNTYNY